MHGFISFLCLLIFIILSTRTSAQKISLNEPVEDWDKHVQSFNVETKYRVKKGDNLYDISSILFGDAHYWPKVWSLNRSLTNPHEVQEGQVIYFDSGSLTKPPSIGFSGAESGSYILAESYKEPIIPKQTPKMHIKRLPITFPKTFGDQVTQETEERILEQIEVGEELVLKEKESVMLYTEIMIKKPKSMGTIQVIEDGSLFAKVGDFVVLNLKSSVFSWAGAKCLQCSYFRRVLFSYRLVG